MARAGWHVGNAASVRTGKLPAWQPPVKPECCSPLEIKMFHGPDLEFAHFRDCPAGEIPPELPRHRAISTSGGSMNAQNHFS
jgi:hypothetical protein